MPLTSCPRSPFTNWIITQLETENFPVGDNTHPEESYGWQGEPNGTNSYFIPWMTVTPGPSRSQTPPGALADSGTEWIHTYNVLYAGVSRKQCEGLADKQRAILCGTSRVTVPTPTGSWRIMKVSCTSIGSNNRVSGTIPDYSTQSDTFDVWVTKER